MDKQGISIMDLLKIAVKWLWLLVAAAIVGGALAFAYSTAMVKPQYSAKSTFCIQTKGQNAETDVLESQRNVAYAQLVVGTYIEILNTRDFADEVAFYLNGNVKDSDYGVDERLLDVVARAGKEPFYAGEDTDATLFEQKKTVYALNEQSTSFLIHGEIDSADIINLANNPKAFGLENKINAETSQTESSYEIVAFKTYQERKDLKVFDTNENSTTAKKVEDIEKSELPSVYVYISGYAPTKVFVEEILPGFERAGLVKSNFTESEKITELRKIGLAEGTTEKEYTGADIKGMLSFSFEEESISFDVTTKSGDPAEAYKIARCIEIISSDYIESKFSDVGAVSVIEKARENKNPVNNNTNIFTLIGMLAGLILAFVIVYIIEITDLTIRDEKDISEKLGESVIGIIPDVQYEMGQNSSGKQIPDSKENERK